MIEARPSRTALRVAMRRAAHQLFDNPKVLDDPIAVPIVGPKAAEKLKTESPDAFARSWWRAVAMPKKRWRDQSPVAPRNM
jgi:O-methyltransferase involved in polyketide biosynthesis